VPQPHAFHRGLGEVESSGSKEIECAAFRIEEPFARRVQFLEVEARDGLRLVVLGDGEIIARQSAHDGAALVAYDDVDQHELGT